jgi:hypothetical protein
VRAYHPPRQGRPNAGSTAATAWRGYSTSLTESFSNGSSSPSALMVPRPTETMLRVCLDELVFCSSHTWPHLTKAAALEPTSADSPLSLSVQQKLWQSDRLVSLSARCSVLLCSRECESSGGARGVVEQQEIRVRASVCMCVRACVARRPVAPRLKAWSWGGP